MANNKKVVGNKGNIYICDHIKYTCLWLFTCMLLAPLMLITATIDVSHAIEIKEIEQINMPNEITSSDETNITNIPYSELTASDIAPDIMFD